MKSFLDKIRHWWKLRRSVKGVRCAYIVDVGGLNEQLRSRRRMAPREQLALLDKVSRFARREKVKLFMVFESRPLRKVPDGSEYREVGVYYSGEREKLANTIIRLFHRLKGTTDITVVTSDGSIEEEVTRCGGKIMHSSTFKRALEAATPPEARKQRRTRRRSSGGQARERAAEPKPDDTIDSMIDVVR